MSANRVRAAYVELQRLVARECPVQPGDGQLLERYVCHRDEKAFAMLVDRHGPMVMGVCRRVLRQTQDAEDAFQATFIVLARRASSIRQVGSTGSWLYGVAYRTALKARALARRRQRRETVVGQALATAEPAVRVDDLRELLDAELLALPERLRQPLVLAYFEGKSKEEVASELGWPTGTVSSRLARGREMLRQRLVRRGILLAMPVLVATLEAEARAAVPAALIERIGVSISCGCTAATRTVDLLVKGVLLSMFWTKTKVVLGIGLVAIGLTLGTGYEVFQSAAGQNPSGQNPLRTANDGGRAANVVRLKHTSAVEVQAVLEKLFKSGDKDKAALEPTIVAETRTNSILFSATPQQKAEIEKLIQEIDNLVTQKLGGALAQGGKLPDLAKAKRDAAEEEVKFRQEAFEADRGDIESFGNASKRLLEAQRGLASTKEDIAFALGVHKQRMFHVRAIAEERHKAGKLKGADYALIRYFAIEAEMLTMQGQASGSPLLPQGVAR